MKSHRASRPAFPALALPVALSLAFLSGLTGCGLLAAGASSSAVAYVEGTLETELGAEFARVAEVTPGAIKALEFIPISEKSDALKARFISRTALDKKVEINLTKAGDRVTKVQIHVGFLGDQELSMAILDKIKRGL